MRAKLHGVTDSEVSMQFVLHQHIDVSSVAIDYLACMPTGKAILTVSSPDLAEENFRLLSNFTIMGFPIDVRTISEPASYGRGRGIRGRQDAINRGIFDGCGPNAGVLNTGTHVTIWGLPRRAGPPALAKILEGFHLKDIEEGKAIVPIPRSVGIPFFLYSLCSCLDLRPEKLYSTASRFLVMAESASEAHRIVRALHMTDVNPEMFGEGWQLQARVVY